MMLTKRTNYGYDLFEDLFNAPFFGTSPVHRDTSLMKTDIREKDGNYLLDIELPGFEKDKVHAELKDGYLLISAERSDNSEEKDEKGKYVRRERFMGTCKRSFYVGEDMRQEDIKASFSEGILHLIMPKEAPKKIEEKPTYIAIQ